MPAFFAFILRLIQGFGIHITNIFVALIRCIAISGWLPFFLKFTNLDERIQKLLIIVVSLPIFLIALTLLYYGDTSPENNPVLEGETAEHKVMFFIAALVVYGIVMGLIFLVRRVVKASNIETEE